MQHPSASDSVSPAPVASSESSWRVTLTHVLNVLSICAALVLIVSISLEAFSGQVFVQGSVYERIQLWVCLYFLLDLFVLMLLSPQKMRFLARHFLLILISIPYLSLFEFFSLSFSHEVQYALRFLPILRGGITLFVLVKMVVSNKITGLFVAYLVCFFSLVYFQTLIFFVFENGKNPLIHTYYDALWWAAMTVTTLGSNILPVTTMGKVSTTFLATCGMTVLPIFTAYITSLIQRVNHSKGEASEN